MRRLTFLMGFFFFFCIAFSQTQSHTSMFIGHSLVNFNMPHFFDQLAEDAGHTSNVDVQIINGSPLQLNWENSNTAQGTDSRATLPNGNYDILVMTERVPLMGTFQYHNSPLYAGNFYDLAITSRGGTQVYMYETWHCVESGTPAGCAYDPDSHLDWRDRLDTDLNIWMEIVDSVNSMYSHTPEMLLVPGGQALGSLYDAIEAGTVPGLTNIRDVFADDIHMNTNGNYFIASVHYATIYKESPVGLTNEIYNEWGTLITTDLSAELAARLQQIAWEAVTSCPYSGVTSESYEVQFTVTDGTNPIQDVAVTYNGLVQNTTASGQVTFTNVPVGTRTYSMEKTAYLITQGAVEVIDQNESVTVTMTSASQYNVTITGGTGSGTFYEDEIVSIAADLPSAGMAFDQWTGDISVLTSATSSQATFSMPGQDVNLTATYKEGCSATGELLMEKYDDITGTAIAELTQSQIYPNSPTSTAVISDLFEAPTDVDDQYGVRISGLLCAPQTGDYIFWIAGDDAVELSISTDADPANKSAIANHNAWTSPRAWAQYATQQSEPISLIEGQQYYIEALMKEGGGGDNLAVGWQLPDATLERPIPASYFSQPSNDPPATFTLTVNSGTGDGNYTAGTTISISADAPSAGQEFDAWTGDVGHLQSATSATTNLTMPSAAVTVAATYRDIPTYTLSVSNGTGDGNYEEGETITIEADAPSTGQEFEGWSGDIQYIANATSSSTTVTMPAANISITATYQDIPPLNYALTVNHGSGDGNYVEGQSVTIQADPATTGQVFDGWTGDVQFLADASSSATTLTMPAANVTITATYVAVINPTYTLIVNNGSGDGSYEQGTVVNIIADYPQAGEEFAGWTGDVQYIANVASPTTTLTMPASEVNISAAFQPITSPTYTVTFTITDGENPVQGAIVVYNQEIKTTDASGIAVFENVAEGSGLVYTISANGFESNTVEIDVVNDVTKAVVLSTQTTEIAKNPLKVQVYPNPAVQYVNIMSNQPIQNVQLINLNGKVIKTFEGMNQNQMKIDVTDLTSGLYLIKIYQGTQNKDFILIKD